MEIAYPHNVWWSIAVAGVIWFACLALVRRRRAIRRLCPLRAARPQIRTVAGTLLRTLAVLLLGVAVLGPCLGERTTPTPPAKGRDLYVLLDVSRSMLAEDVAPNRLERAKAGLRDLAAELEKHGGCRVGLIAFAERPALLCPLTTDFRHFLEELRNASLQSVRLRGAALAPVDGTQLGLALERVISLAPKTDANQRGLDLLLVSDGGDDADEGLSIETGRLAERGIAAHTLGIGDPLHGSAIPVLLPDGRRDLVRFQGQLVQTRLVEAPLERIAQQTSGRYIPARTGALPLAEVLTEITSKPEHVLPTTSQLTIPLHRFQWFLLPAVVLLLLENVARVRTRQVATGRRLHAPWLARLVPPARRPEPNRSELVTQA